MGGLTVDFVYKTRGTCSREIHIEIENNIVKNVSFKKGCNGNLKGICKLIQGMPVDEVINKLKGIKCGDKDTSCPDQLSIALEQAKNQIK